jgi:hypothetical protein
MRLLNQSDRMPGLGAKPAVRPRFARFIMAGLHLRSSVLKNQQGLLLWFFLVQPMNRSSFLNLWLEFGQGANGGGCNF